MNAKARANRLTGHPLKDEMELRRRTAAAALAHRVQQAEAMGDLADELLMLLLKQAMSNRTAMMDGDRLRVARLALERSGRLVQRDATEGVTEIIVRYEDGAPGTLPPPSERDVGR